jgi:hypothetical protein
MYSIIYWLENDEAVYPVRDNERGGLKVFESLAEADQEAEAIESKIKEADCRVITIESVKE